MTRKTTKMSEKTIALTMLGIVVVIAVIGLLLSMGVVKTGKVWQMPPTAAVCKEGYIKAWAHSTEHVEMLKANMTCQNAMVKGFVCCV